jgi:galactokinase
VRRPASFDQLAALFGRAAHAIRLDMRSLAITPVPLELGGYRLVTVDSGVSHVHAGSGYNDRRGECRLAAAMLGVSSLRDAATSDADALPPPLDARLRHLISENERVDAAVAALSRGDLPALGRLLDASHASLRDDFDTSVPAVEATIERVKRAGAIGVRMVGGGFGGSVLALLPPRVEPPAGAVAVDAGPAAAVA